MKILLNSKKRRILLASADLYNVLLGAKFSHNQNAFQQIKAARKVCRAKLAC